MVLCLSATASPFFWPQRYTQIGCSSLPDQTMVKHFLRLLWATWKGSGSTSIALSTTGKQASAWFPKPFSQVWQRPQHQLFFPLLPSLPDSNPHLRQACSHHLSFLPMLSQPIPKCGTNIHVPRRNHTGKLIQIQPRLEPG